MGGGGPFFPGPGKVMRANRVNARNQNPRRLLMQP